MKKFYNENSIKLCKKDNCIEAKGEFGEIITFAASIMLLFIGVSALVKATK